MIASVVSDAGRRQLQMFEGPDKPLQQAWHEKNLPYRSRLLLLAVSQFVHRLLGKKSQSTWIPSICNCLSIPDWLPLRRQPRRRVSLSAVQLFVDLLVFSRPHTSAVQPSLRADYLRECRHGKWIDRRNMASIRGCLVSTDGRPPSDLFCRGTVMSVLR